jgi:hypothetical protein
MIIVSLMGGLGNQMFQYASAKNLSIIHNTVLKIDALNFRKLTANREHVFQLDCFNISAPQASEDEISRYNPQERKHLKIIKRIRKTLKLSVADIANPYLYSEPDGSCFKPDFFELGPDKYLIGYFNSHKYFAPIRDVLVEEYTPREDISVKARELINQIENTNSVSIHIRRGDYVDDPNVRKSIEGIITERYYRNALESIADRVADPHFFIFSNDMGWVRAHFRIPFKVTYVDINPPHRGFEDVWIMSKCRHNITAGGSTFSWWAAYLNRNADKIVVRTEKISNDPEYNHPDDYFPPEWEIAAS